MHACIHMYVCIIIYVYTCFHVCMNVCMCLWKYVCSKVCIYLWKCVCRHLCMCLSICIYVHVKLYMYVMYACMHDAYIVFTCTLLYVALINSYIPYIHTFDPQRLLLSLRNCLSLLCSIHQIGFSWFDMRRGL